MGSASNVRERPGHGHKCRQAFGHRRQSANRQPRHRAVAARALRTLWRPATRKASNSAGVAAADVPGNGPAASQSARLVPRWFACAAGSPAQAAAPAASVTPQRR